MDIKNELKTNALKILKCCDPELSYIFERIRRKMIKKASHSDKPLSLPSEINIDYLPYIMESYYNYYEKIHEKKHGILKNFEYEEDSEYRFLCEFRNSVKRDEAVFELLTTILKYPDIKNKDKKLGGDAQSMLI